MPSERLDWPFLVVESNSESELLLVRQGTSGDMPPKEQRVQDKLSSSKFLIIAEKYTLFASAGEVICQFLSSL